jgi:peroxiredoxin
VAIGVGEALPDFAVLRALEDVVASVDLFASGPTVLHFYILDFTGRADAG